MSELKTIDIKGKPYVTVAERIKAFRENLDGWSIETNIIDLTDQKCVMQAIVRDENGVIKATGTAYEMAGSTYINKTSYIENCETSAWGRALGCLGIGVDAEIASYDEVANDILQQNTDKKGTPKAPAKQNKTDFSGQYISDLTELEKADGNRPISEKSVKMLNSMLNAKRKMNEPETMQFYREICGIYKISKFSELKQADYKSIADAIGEFKPTPC